MVTLKNLSLQGRILGLVVAGFLLCGVILGLWRQRQQAQIARILEFVQEERGQAFEKSLQSEGQTLRSYVSENSYWDELVAFTKSKNQTWAKASLSPPDRAAIPLVVVLDTEFRILYRNGTGLEIDRQTYETAAQNLSKPGVVRFFTRNAKERIVEVFVAPISKSSDSQHVGKTYGYLAAGRVWDQSVLSDLATLTGATLTLRASAQELRTAPTPAPGRVRAAFKLEPIVSGEPPVLLADFDVALAERLKTFSEESLELFLAFGAVLIGSVALALLGWVHNPLKTLTGSLREGNLTSLSELERAGPEFRELGALVRNFTSQKEALYEANESLEQRVEERTANLRAALESLQRAQQRFQEVIHHTPVTLFVLDADGRVTLLEGQGVGAARLRRERMVGRSAYRLWGMDPYATRRIRSVLDSGNEEGFTVEVRDVMFDVRMRPLRDPGGEVTGAIGIAIDVTERQRFEAALRHQALHDALTGLPNRVHFREQLDRALREARLEKTLVGILFLDLDNFKLINDSLGHEVGDRLLKGLALRLQEAVAGRGFVARLAGDEFTVLLERAESRASVESMASKVSASLTAPFDIAGRELYANGSIGIALAENGAVTSTEMLRHADVAMYRAKQAGRGRWSTFDESMSHNLNERLELESDLRTAAARGELEVFYQPIVRLADRKIEEVEALLRWRHPRLGLIQPARFIQIAEESGSIIGLDFWTIKQACTDIKAWNDVHPEHPLTLSANLSVHQFQPGPLVTVINKTLEATGLEATRLKLEITEGTMMADPHTAASLLTSLKQLGVRIAIDDFGTGYSSMTYLGSLPLDTLKIDRSFIRQMNERTASLAIVRAIRQLAGALDLDVTCEGIETEAQVEPLRRMGCQRGQGYLFGRPMPIAQLRQRLEEDLAQPSPVELSRAA